MWQEWIIFQSCPLWLVFSSVKLRCLPILSNKLGNDNIYTHFRIQSLLMIARLLKILQLNLDLLYYVIGSLFYLFNIDVILRWLLTSVIYNMNAAFSLLFVTDLSLSRRKNKEVKFCYKLNEIFWMNNSVYSKT